MNVENYIEQLCEQVSACIKIAGGSDYPSPETIKQMTFGELLTFTLPNGIGWTVSPPKPKTYQMEPQ